jgi:ethanolamine utilization protein EutN
MFLGRVRGTVVATIKDPGMTGVKLLVVQPVDRHQNPVGVLSVAVDTVMAGDGDLCVLARSREAALAMPGEKFVPVDLAITGIVDQLSVRPDGEFDITLKMGVNRYA